MPNANSSSATRRDGDEPAPTVGNVNRVGNAPRAFIVNTQDDHGEALQYTVRDGEHPMSTFAASGNGRYRAFIVPAGGHSENGGGLPIDKDRPHATLRAQQGANSHAWLETGRVVKMTPRALARFQSFPDWYRLPEKTSLACRIIGNAVPPLMYAAIARSVTE